MQKQAPSIGRYRDRVGFALSCFGLLLFLWVDLRRAGPVQADELPLHAPTSPRRSRSPKEADVRIGGVSVGKVKEIDAARAKATRPEPTIEIDAEYAPISLGRPGDPAPEDAAGGDLHRAHARQPAPRRRPGGTAEAREHARRGDDAGEPLPEGGHLDDTQVARPGPDRRDLPGARRRDPRRFQHLDEERRHRDRRPRPRPQRRLRQPRPLHRGRQRRARHPAPPGGAAARAGRLDGHRLRCAHRARPGAGGRDRRLQPDLPRARLARRGPGRDLQDPSRPSRSSRA